MAEKGILFNGDMMRAIRADAKTQTRRPVKLDYMSWLNCRPVRGGYMFESPGARGFEAVKPPYAVGDILYCRETWCWDAFKELHYRADCLGTHDEFGTKLKWRPSIHMPKWAAREWLKVTAVRAEQGPKISLADAIAEGFKTVEEFNDTWRAIYGDNANWRWVTEFERKQDGQTEDSSGAGAPGR